MRELITSLQMVLLVGVLLPASLVRGNSGSTMLHEEAFHATQYGRTPAGWRDAFDSRPTRAWAVDGSGFLRQMLKNQTGLLLWEGQTELADVTLTAEFKKTEDEEVSFGLILRALNRDNFYLVRFRGADRMELMKVKDGEESALDYVKPLVDASTRPTGIVTLERYEEGKVWKLVATIQDELLTAIVYDDAGREMARLSVVDDEYKEGAVGIRATRFASAASFRLETAAAVESPSAANPLPEVRQLDPDYPVLKPHWNVDELNTPMQQVADQYDLVVAGAGTGGWAAAVQAARLGLRVLLLEETDWIGGQMACAGVTTMDEASGWWKYSVRERGIYREFHESMVTHYLTMEKDPIMAYFSYPHQTEGGYEPRVARAVMYSFIKHARDNGGTLDLSLRSRVTDAAKDGNTVTAVTVQFDGVDGTPRKEIGCKLLVDATEYGDVISLTGARYRTGNRISDNIDPGAVVQDHTWLAIVREYPEGVPDHLRIQQPPPGYETIKKRFSNYRLYGLMVWGAEGKGLKGPRLWRHYFAWRGLADSASSLTGDRSTQRHTRSGFNGGNDYPVTAATLEDPAVRSRDEREGIYRSLGILYYFQNELGIPWALAEDEGYNTPYNQWKMKQLDLRPDLEALAVHMPQQPYVRESRRIVGVYTITGGDLARRDDNATLFPTSVAMGDYGMDLDHGDTANAIEADLDSGELPRESGPYMVPFEVFIPELIDGFIAAEKNISQSRRASGATRMQPSTMLMGQAAGAIAALSVKQGKQPRELDPLQVQSLLLDAGSTLVPRWHSDVPWRTPIWKATQLLSLYQVMDRPGGLTHDRRPLGVTNPWGVDEPLKPAELQAAISQLAKMRDITTPASSIEGDTVSVTQLQDVLQRVNPQWAKLLQGVQVQNKSQVTAGEFALIAVRCLVPQPAAAASATSVGADQ